MSIDARSPQRVRVLSQHVSACPSAPGQTAVTAQEVSFPAAADGATLRGRLLGPAGAGAPKVPGIVVAHGFSATFKMGIIAYAEKFAEAGYCVLAFDHAGFGVSDGEPRRDICFWRQADGYRDAISFLQSQPSVDPSKIALWGVSFSGSVALSVAAVDERVSAVLAVTPGLEVTTAPDEEAFAKFRRDMLDRAYMSAAVKRRIGPHPVIPRSLQSADDSDAWFGNGLPFLGGHERSGREAAHGFYSRQGARDRSWVNEATMVARKMNSSAGSGVFMHFLQNVAVHMALAEDDQLIPRGGVERAFAAVPSERKQLLEIAGDHFKHMDTHMPKVGDYPAEFQQCVCSQIEFLSRHMRRGERSR